MRFLDFDKYGSRESPVHRVSSSVKLVLSLVLVVSVVLLPQGLFVPLGAVFLLLLLVCAVSRVPPGFVLMRSLVTVPFILVIGAVNLIGSGSAVITEGGTGASSASGAAAPRLYGFLFLASKAYICTLTSVLLVSTTGSRALFAAMRRVGLPAALVTLLAFTVRYIHVAVNELVRMKRARESRLAGRLPRIVELRSLAGLAGVLFIRSYERAERVYLAMCARGFEEFAGEEETCPRRRESSRSSL
ncbi:MAG: cobalt ECF transporter T component CbiQ [Candidatus Eisenbacteria bacterium]